MFMDRETVKDRIKAKKSERSSESDDVIDGDRPEWAAHNAIEILAAKLTAMGEPGTMLANLTLPVDVLKDNPEVFTAYDAKHVQTLTKMLRSDERLLPIIVALVYLSMKQDRSEPFFPSPLPLQKEQQNDFFIYLRIRLAFCTLIFALWYFDIYLPEEYK